MQEACARSSRSPDAILARERVRSRFLLAAAERRGRLADMSLGIECLVTGDRGRALEIARQLDDLNRERRAIEADMQSQADDLLAKLSVGDSCTISLYDPSWHQGVIGILAGRVKDRHHRPTFAFAPGNGGELRGSGRSIAGLHLRDALDLVTKQEPGLLLRFGGHAAAAGASCAPDFPSRKLARSQSPAQQLARTVRPTARDCHQPRPCAALEIDLGPASQPPSATSSRSSASASWARSI
jgi:hypothetical protein